MHFRKIFERLKEAFNVQLCIVHLLCTAATTNRVGTGDIGKEAKKKTLEAIVVMVLSQDNVNSGEHLRLVICGIKSVLKISSKQVVK